MPPAPITATVEPASVPSLSCGSHDQARAYWLMPRTPASSSASACSATCAAYAPAAVVNVTPGVARTRSTHDSMPADCSCTHFTEAGSSGSSSG